MSRLAARLRRRVTQRKDDGFTLIELMAAITLLAIILTGFARVTGAELISTLHSHVQEAETSFMNQELEEFRSMSFTGLALDPAQYTSSTYTDPSSGTSYSVVFSTSGCGSGTSPTCVPYATTLSIANVAFTETRVVVGVGTSPNWNYKKVFVTLSSASHPTFTYNATTDVSGATTNNPASVNTLQVITQAVTSSGAQLNDSSGNAVVPPDGFAVAVTGTASDSGNTTDGVWSTTNLGAGTYTCTVTNPGAGYQDWVSYPNLTSTSTGNCTAPGTFTSQWEQQACTTGTAKGSLTVTVTNAAGTAINGANITLTVIGSQTGKAPGAVKTNASGIATFSGTVPAGPWGVSINPAPAGYFNLTGASTCVWGSSTSLLSMNLVPNGGAPKTATVSIPVQNSAAGGTSTMELQALDSNGTEYLQQQDLDGGAQSTFTLQVDATTTYTGSYTVTLYCTGVGGSTSDGNALTSWTTSAALAANSTWTPTGISSSSPAAYSC